MLFRSGVIVFFQHIDTVDLIKVNRDNYLGIGPCRRRSNRRAARRALPRPCQFDRKIRLPLLLAALGTGAVAFALRLQWPVGREVAGLQIGYFASYVVLFVAGCLAASPQWLEHWPAAQVRTWRRVAWLALPVLPVVVLGSPLLGLQGRPEGGWNIPAHVYALWEPFVAWGVILTLLGRFQRRFIEIGPSARGWRDARSQFTSSILQWSWR